MDCYIRRRWLRQRERGTLFGIICTRATPKGKCPLGDYRGKEVPRVARVGPVGSELSRSDDDDDNGRVRRPKVGGWRKGYLRTSGRRLDWLKATLDRRRYAAVHDQWAKRIASVLAHNFASNSGVRYWSGMLSNPLPT